MKLNLQSSGVGFFPIGTIQYEVGIGSVKHLNSHIIINFFYHTGIWTFSILRYIFIIQVTSGIEPNTGLNPLLKIVLNDFLCIKLFFSFFLYKIK